LFLFCNFIVVGFVRALESFGGTAVRINQELESVCKIREK
jgi:hypothetical protein